MSKYFSIVSSCTGNLMRTWWHAEFEIDGPLKKIHEDFGLVFFSKDACIEEIIRRVERFGGKYFGSYDELKHRKSDF